MIVAKPSPISHWPAQPASFSNLLTVIEYRRFPSAACAAAMPNALAAQKIANPIRTCFIGSLSCRLVAGMLDFFAENLCRSHAQDKPQGESGATKG